ncbi:MAG TPA: hypothetical protein VGD81_17625 [Opitutaceae bacterium]
MTALAGLENSAWLADTMTALDVIKQLETLPPGEVAKVRAWLTEHEEESPELLAAIDEGLRSLETKGARITTRDELEMKVRRWADGSR